VSRLDRFRDAQASAHAGFESAMEELRAGGKRSHWIWYIFPQIEGLGASALSKKFALKGEQEAAEFLSDAELRSRLLRITRLVAEQLRSGKGKSLSALMGSDIDARKVVSSLTLFAHVARKLHEVEGMESIADAADEVLTLAASQGYPLCSHTLRCIEASSD